MVNSIGSAPYSYLDQLLNGTTGAATVPFPAVTSPVDNSTNTSSSSDDMATAAKALGLSPTVLALLQNVGDSATSQLLGVGQASTENNPFASLFGYSTQKTGAEVFAGLQSNLFGTNASSGLYLAALNAASAKKAHDTAGTDYMSKVLSAYNAAFTYSPGSTLDITG